MTTDYNQISQQYKQAKQQPWRWAVETYSLMKLVGDLQGKSIVDVACGEGYFTRLLRQAGAASVLGLDISQAMIELARAEERASRWALNTLSKTPGPNAPRRELDLAVAAWLLVYAHDRAELAEMCRGLARLLRPGGRFVTYTTNPDVYFYPKANYRKYGFELALADRAYEGAPINWTIDLGDTKFEIQNYYLPIEAYQEAFESAGFGDFRMHQPTLAPEAEAELGREFWSDFLEYPAAVLMDCVKG